MWPEFGGADNAPGYRVSIKPFPESAGKPAPVMQTEKEIVSLLTKLLEPEKEMGGGLPYELTEEYLRRKKKKRPKISH